MAAFSLIELLFALGLAATIGAVSLPQAWMAIDDARAVGAARYLATRLQRTRMEAIVRNSSVALRVTRSGSDYWLDEYVDGDGDGVLSRDIRSGIDTPVSPQERIDDRFAGVTFGALPGLPPIDVASAAPGADPIRLGSSDMAVFTPTGTSTSGSLYLLGRRNLQLAVRIYGDTGKTRALRFHARTQQWIPLSSS